MGRVLVLHTQDPGSIPRTQYRPWALSTELDVSLKHYWVCVAQDKNIRLNKDRWSQVEGKWSQSWRLEWPAEALGSPLGRKGLLPADILARGIGLNYLDQRGESLCQQPALSQAEKRRCTNHPTALLVGCIGVRGTQLSFTDTFTSLPISQPCYNGPGHHPFLLSLLTSLSSSAGDTTVTMSPFSGSM